MDWSAVLSLSDSHSDGTHSLPLMQRHISPKPDEETLLSDESHLAGDWLVCFLSLTSDRREGRDCSFADPCFRCLLVCRFLLRALHSDPAGVCADLRGAAQTGQTHRTFTQTRPPSRARRWTAVPQGVLGKTLILSLIKHAFSRSKVSIM